MRAHLNRCFSFKNLAETNEANHITCSAIPIPIQILLNNGNFTKNRFLQNWNYSVKFC